VFNLTCWANYTFRVKATNRLGDSDPSEINTIPCYTNPCRPSRHPIGVRAFGNQSNNLIITWNVRNKYMILNKVIFLINLKKVMPMIDWNAPIFWYQVEYRQVAKNNLTMPTDFIRIKVPADRDTVVIQNTPAYTEYEFYVKAFNQQAGDGIGGEATETAKLYRGFSGEDSELLVLNFR
jgi:hypothetical protein